MNDTLKLSSTLADETRYSIYQFIAKETSAVNVQQIAKEFNIHPNVARLHLTKLTESKLIVSNLEKKSQGGRPARVYEIANDPLHLSFPKQENRLLLGWLIELVSTSGEDTWRKAKDISYQSGKKAIPNIPTSFEEKVKVINEVADFIGYIPSILEQEGKRIITFQVYNCPYKGLINDHSEIVCSLHESYLKGIYDSLFPENEFIQLESMITNCANCVYKIKVL